MAVVGLGALVVEAALDFAARRERKRRGRWNYCAPGHGEHVSACPAAQPLGAKQIIATRSGNEVEAGVAAGAGRIVIFLQNGAGARGEHVEERIELACDQIDLNAVALLECKPVTIGQPIVPTPVGRGEIAADRAADRDGGRPRRTGGLLRRGGGGPRQGGRASGQKQRIQMSD